MSLHSFSVLVLVGVSLLLATEASLEDRAYWEHKGAEELEAALKVDYSPAVARNVIVFVGDGMGPNTVAAARIYRAGEASSLAFEKFPHVGMLKTYVMNKQVPESASTATAMFCGIKVNFETLGLDSKVSKFDCQGSLLPENRLSSIVSWAQAVGKSTGFVTTTRVTHATPAALYAHSAERNWECEASMPPEASACKDIARQLVEDAPGKDLQVIMGGGRQCLSANVKSYPNDPIDLWACARKDNKDLIRDWIDDKNSRGLRYAYLNNNAGFADLNTNKTDYLLGIFSNGHMNFDYQREKGPQGMPSLSTMATTAIKVLSNNEKGFVLVVEGGLIDTAHHLGNARKALHETVAFSNAINESMALLKQRGMLDDTLVIVTSDHTHTLTINGYPSRGNNILGVAMKSKADGVPYTTLTYGAAGKHNYHFNVSSNGTVQREDPTTVDTTAFEYSQQSSILTNENTHGGGDVIVFATGPMSHLFHTIHEQSYVATVVSYAARLRGEGTHDKHSDSIKSVMSPACRQSATPLLMVSLVMCCIIQLKNRS